MYYIIVKRYKTRHRYNRKKVSTHTEYELYNSQGTHFDTEICGNRFGNVRSYASHIKRTVGGGILDVEIRRPALVIYRDF